MVGLETDRIEFQGRLFVRVQGGYHWLRQERCRWAFRVNRASHKAKCPHGQPWFADCGDCWDGPTNETLREWSRFQWQLSSWEASALDSGIAH